MVRTHKRKKSSRIRGSRTAGWGFRQKHKGPGNSGGHGMAGSGKRADHKKQFARNLDTSKRHQYFGKQGLTSRAAKKKQGPRINLRDIKANFFKDEKTVIELTKHTILGTGEGFKATIHAKHASPSALQKMKAAGGTIMLPEKKSENKNKKEDNAEKTKQKAEKKDETKETKTAQAKSTPVKKAKPASKSVKQ